MISISIFLYFDFSFSFIAKKILDQSVSFIDLTPTPASMKKADHNYSLFSSIVTFIGKTPSPELVKLKPSRSVTPEEKHTLIKGLFI
jgi:hypothetical protein